MNNKIPNEKINSQKTMFSNRLIKKQRHLKKWAKRNNISCYRLYDKDIPEIPLIVDLYTEAKTNEEYLYLCLYQRPYKKAEEDEAYWLNEMSKTASNSLEIKLENIFIKERFRLKGRDLQYEKSKLPSERIIINEGGLGFYVNLVNYLDTGIFMDHRQTRKLVADLSANKSVLNLFCYTGSFSVYAAYNGASRTTSVDLSNTYLQWAIDNFKLNGLQTSKIKKHPSKEKNEFVKADVFEFLDYAINNNFKYDIIILDPPTFSNSKDTKNILDINKDWAKLCENCLLLLNKGGTLFFSTNSNRLKFNSNDIKTSVKFTVKDKTLQTIPEDFKNKKAHRLWTFSV